MSSMQEIEAVLKPLTKAKVAEVMSQLEGLLQALPANASSDTDARLRQNIEVLLAGYKAGAPRLRPKTQAVD